jgi:hypothetical protein
MKFWFRDLNSKLIYQKTFKFTAKTQFQVLYTVIGGSTATNGIDRDRKAYAWYQNFSQKKNLTPVYLFLIL